MIYSVCNKHSPKISMMLCIQQTLKVVYTNFSSQPVQGKRREGESGEADRRGEKRIIWLFLAVLGLHCFGWASSSYVEWDASVVVCGLLIAVAPLVAEHVLQVHRFSSHGAQAELPHGRWDPPRPGIELMSPASAGGYLTMGPLVKSKEENFRCNRARAREEMLCRF